MKKKDKKSLENLIRQKDFLKARSKPVYRKALLEKADKKLIRAIQESIYNALKGNISYSADEIQKLKKYKNILRKIVKNKNKENKKILVQKGGFLEVLLPAVITGISTIVSSLLNKS